MSDLEQAKKRLDQALLKLDGLVSKQALNAPSPSIAKEAALDGSSSLQAQNKSLQTENSAIQAENQRLKETASGLSNKLDSVLVKLESVMEGDDESAKDND